MQNLSEPRDDRPFIVIKRNVYKYVNMYVYSLMNKKLQFTLLFMTTYFSQI